MMPSQSFHTTTGLSLEQSDGLLASISCKTTRLPLPGPPRSPFSVVDMEEKSHARRDFAPLGEKNGAYACESLGLSLQAAFAAAPDAIEIRCHLANEREGDRALSFFFEVPVTGKGLRWYDDIRRSRAISPACPLYEKTEPAASGSGSISVYPIGAITGKTGDGTAFGLSLGIDIARPASFRIGYDTSRQSLQIRFDAALVPESKRFPSAADFKLVVQSFDPTWGFRAAFDAYMRHYPDAFAVRARSQGLWMPFTAIETVENWRDFGFAFHEGGDDSHGFDRENGIQPFHYTEPFTWWLPMPSEMPRTYENAVKLQQEALEDDSNADSFRREHATAAVTSAMHDAKGRFALSFHDLPWCDGACWALNPSPFLPGKTTGFTVNWSEKIAERRYGPGSLLCGEYVDSVEGYTTPELNFRREHFKYATCPLSYDAKTLRPGILKGIAVFECVRQMALDMRKRGKLLFGNGVPYRFCWLLGAFDIMGTETTWLGKDGSSYAPLPDEQMALWRTLSGRKPYLLLQNTDFHAFDHTMVDRYLQRSLFYGIYPSMFSVDAASDPYWADPALYNRDRDLFKRYIPLVREIGEEGWEPVTWATSSNPEVLVDRFGSRYLTVFNGTERESETRIHIGIPVGRTARERITDTRLTVSDDKDLLLSVPAQSARLIDLMP